VEIGVYMVEIREIESTKVVRTKPEIPEKIRNKIFPVILRLFSDNDFHQVKMRTIIKESGLSSGTIYKYFSSKEDILFYTLEKKFEGMQSRIRGHVQGLRNEKEIVRKIFWETLDYYDKNPRLAIVAFITVPMQTWMQQRGYLETSLKKIFTEILPTLKASGGVDDRIDVRLFQDIYYMICYRYIHTWYYFGMKWKLVDAVYNDFDVLWKMFAKEEKHFNKQ
jgi:AcrR family transcriptional regulator